MAMEENKIKKPLECTWQLREIILKLLWPACWLRTVLNGMKAAKGQDKDSAKAAKCPAPKASAGKKGPGKKRG